MLSQIFLNQKGISEQMAERMSEKLHLNTVDAIGMYLNLPSKNIEQVLNALLHLNIIQINEGKIIALSNFIHTANDIPTLAIKDYHVSMTEKMHEALEQHLLTTVNFKILFYLFQLNK